MIGMEDAAPGKPATDERVGDLVLIVRRLVQELRKYAPSSRVASEAMDYLRRKAPPVELLRAGPPAPVPKGAVAIAYEVGDLCVERVEQRDGSFMWAVRNLMREVLNKDGQWEWEPMPSGRDKHFLDRCRFATAEGAIAVARSKSRGEGESC